MTAFSIQKRFGGGGHFSAKDRNNTSGLGGPSPGEDYGANKDDNPYLWDPHYMPCEESDYERHHCYLEKHEKDRYAIPEVEWNHKLSRADVLARIVRLVQALPRANTENRTISQHTHLYNDLGLDSLDAVEFGLAVEAEFELEFMDEEAEQIVTIGDAIELIVEAPTAN